MIIQLSPRYVIYTLSKRWKIFAFVFFGCLLIGGLYVRFIPWRYASNAEIVVKVDERDVADVDITRPPGQTRQDVSAEIIRRIVNTHLNILRSEEVTRTTLQKLGVAKLYPKIAASPPRYFGTPFDAANARLTKDLAVTVAPNSNTLQVSLLNTNPAVAQLTLRTLIAVFIDKDAEVMRDPRAKFLDEQVAAARAKVDNAQSALLEYKKEHGIVSLDDERSLLLKQRDLLQQDLASENTQSLQQSMAAAHNLLDAAQQRYLQAEQTYGPGNPLLRDSRDALDLARRQYSALMGSLANNPRTEPQQTNRSQRDSRSPGVPDAELTNLWVSQANSVKDRLAQLNQAEGELLNLQRQLDVASQDYTAFMQRTADARVTEALNQQGSPNIAISQEPTLPYEPAQPRLGLVLAMAIALGLVGGLGLCFFLEAMGETIGMPEQVEPLLGVPVIATLNRDRAIRRLGRRPGLKAVVHQSIT